jgi:hypothetical protein
MHFTKYMALKIDIKSTTINAGVHENTVYMGNILCKFLKLGSHQAVLRQNSIKLNKWRGL